MFYILFLIKHKIFLIISSANHYLTKKRSNKQINKKFTFIRVTLDKFLKFINSPGESLVDLSCNLLTEPDIKKDEVEIYSQHIFNMVDKKRPQVT